MKIFVILVAVLLAVESATVPSDVVTHKVTVPVPGNVLSKDTEVEVPAVVVEVTKDHKHHPDMMQKLVESTTDHQVVTTMMPKVIEVTSEVMERVNSPVVTPVVVTENPLPPIVQHVQDVIRQIVHKLGNGLSTDSNKGHNDVTTVVPKVDDAVTTVSSKAMEVTPPEVVEEKVITSELTVPSPVVPPVVVSDNPVPQNVHHVHDVVSESGEDQVVHMPVDESTPVHKVTTVLPLLDDVVTQVNDGGITTIAPDAEEITTDASDSEETTTGEMTANMPDEEGTTEGTEEVTTLIPMVVKEMVNEEAVVVVSNSDVKVTKDKSNEEDSSEENSKDVSNDSSSSKESEESKEKDLPVLPVSSPPIVIEDIIPPPGDILSSLGEADSDLVVIRRRRQVDDESKNSLSAKKSSEGSHSDQSILSEMDKSSSLGKEPHQNPHLAMRQRRAVLEVDEESKNTSSDKKSSEGSHSDKSILSEMEKSSSLGKDPHQNPHLAMRQRRAVLEVDEESKNTSSDKKSSEGSHSDKSILSEMEKSSSLGKDPHQNPHLAMRQRRAVLEVDKESKNSLSAKKSSEGSHSDHSILSEMEKSSSLGKDPHQNPNLAMRQRRAVVEVDEESKNSSSDKKSSEGSHTDHSILSEMEKSPSLVKVPLQNPHLAMRRRRAVPFTEPPKMSAVTGKPRLKTNPQVIAEILAKSKGVQKRYKKSIKPEMDVVPMNEVPLMTKIDDMEDMPPATIDPCDLLCTKFEFDPVCATNGLCLHEFSNQCMLDTYNCKHPKNKFLATKDDRCLMHWLEFCSESELL